METTHNEAIVIAETGNWNEAWKVAQQDEGLNPGVTQEQWTTFAKKAIARREAEAKMHDDVLYPNAAGCGCEDYPCCRH